MFCEKNINKINYNNFDYLNNFFFKYYYDKKDIIIRNKNINNHLNL